MRGGKGMAPPTQPGACDGTCLLFNTARIEEGEAGEEEIAKLRFAFVGGFARLTRLDRSHLSYKLSRDHWEACRDQFCLSDIDVLHLYGVASSHLSD